VAARETAAGLTFSGAHALSSVNPAAVSSTLRVIPVRAPSGGELCAVIA
jgi:hypothetical protein